MHHFQQWSLCLGQGADLHMLQLMPLPFTVSCSSKSRLVLPSWLDKVQEGCKTVVCVFEFKNLWKELCQLHHAHASSCGLPPVEIVLIPLLTPSHILNALYTACVHCISVFLIVTNNLCIACCQLAVSEYCPREWLGSCSGCTDPERWWAGRRVFFLRAKLPF